MTGWRERRSVLVTVRDIACLCLGVAGLLLLHPGGTLLSIGGLVCPAVAAAWLYYDARHESRVAGSRTTSASAALAALLYLFCISSSSGDASFFFLNWRHSGPAWPGVFFSLLFWVNLGFLLATVVATRLKRPLLVRRYASRLCVLLFVAGILFVLVRFFQETRGQLIYMYDHPSFAFRLWALGQSLPRAIFYNPLWNAGRISTYAVTSGSIPLAIVFWPLWKWVDISTAYTPAVASAFVVLLPLGVLLGLRCLRFHWWNASLVALLALGTCRIFFVHLLRFGTIGFLFSSVFFLPAMALTYRMVWRKRVSGYTLLGAVLCWAIVLSWPGAVWLCPAALAAAVFSWRRFDGRRVVKAVACAAVTALILLPLFIGITRHADIGRFMSMTAGAVSRGEYAVAWQGGAQRLGLLLRGVNPLLLVLGMLGWFAMPRGAAKAWSIGWLYFVILAAWGDEWRPQVIFERFIIHASLLSCIPCAYWVGRIGAMQHRLKPLSVALVVCMTIASVWNVGAFYTNQGPESYRLISPPMQGFVKWVRENTPTNGRIAFAGATLHAYGAGQVALLPVLCQREMMACDYYAFSPHKVEYNYPPRAWRDKGPESIRAFWALNGVTHVVTYDRHWIAFFRSHPETYEEHASFMQRTLAITVFSTGIEASRLQQGEGSVESRINGLTLNWTGEGTNAVLRYKWCPELCADGAQLYPVSVAPDTDFIGVTRLDDRTVTEIVF